MAKVSHELLMIRTVKNGVCCCGHADRQRSETFKERIPTKDLSAMGIERLAALGRLEKERAAFLAEPVKCLGCPEPWRQKAGA